MERGCVRRTSRSTTEAEDILEQSSALLPAMPVLVGCISFPLTLALSLRERARVRGKQRSKHQCACLLTPVVERVGKLVFGYHMPPARGAGRVELAKFVWPFWLAASRSPSPLPSPSGRGRG